MKKQINPTIKAHLIRGAFYLLLLLAVCAIPFALAQRNATKRSVANATSNPKTVAKFAVAPPASGAAQATKLSGVHRKAASQPNTGSRLLPYDVRGVPDLPRISEIPQTPSGVRACTNYNFTPGSDPIVPGSADTGNHCDDCDTFVALPFSLTLYDQTFNGVNVSSNGRCDFVTVNEPGGFASHCLPAPPNIGPFDYTVFPLWSDYRTDIVGEGCSTFGGCGIFTSVSGTAPNRIFNIEWRAVYFADHTQTANFEIRLYENNPNKRFDIIFATAQPGSDELYVSGVQGPNNAFTEDFCNASPPAAGSRSYTCMCLGKQMPAYPTTIARYGFAQTATHLYVFGGVSDGSRVNNVNRMDLATGMWQPLAPMPFTSEAPTCALMRRTHSVYCAEGDTGDGFARYDIDTDTWTPLASIPGGDHYGSASGAFNGKVFVVGGTTSFSNAVQVYDVATNTWSAGTPAPSGFLLAGYQQVGQFLYVVGGWTGGMPTGLMTTWRLNMSSAPGVWENGPTFPPGRADFGLAYDAGTNALYALGGDTQGGGFFDSTNEVDELPLAGWPGGTWVPSPPDLLLPNRQGNQAGFYGAGDIWSVGGLEGQTFQFLAEVQYRSNVCGGASPTPTPFCPPTVVMGSIDSGDPTQTDRLFRSGIPQTCPASTSCATFGDGLPRHYDEYMFQNTTGSTQCVMIDTNTACTGTNFIFIGAYLGSFDPNNLCTNWIGDSGGSPNPDQPFQVEIPAGQTFVVVVSEVTPNAGCGSYTVTVTGLCPPRPTQTPRPRPTPAPRP